MRILQAVVAALAFALPAVSAAAQSTLEAVKKRGQLVCGVNGQAPGFSVMNEAKQWSGLDADFCRAVAAAVLGDARKVRFIATSAQDRFTRLGNGEFDVLARNSTINLQRSVGGKVRAAVINYLDGQAFVVAKSANVPTATALAEKMICLVRGTTHQSNVALWFKQRAMPLLVRPFDTPDAMYEAFFAGRCVAVSQDASALAGAVIASGRAAEFMMLPEIISKEPLGPFVRDGDAAWVDIVRWTHYAMVEAEERGITSANVGGLLGTQDIGLQRFLGVLHGNGKALGIAEEWVQHIIKQVGNYGEAFERNVGHGSPLKFARGANALWTRGGIMFSPPFN